jgi:hypothetical protein
LHSVRLSVEADSRLTRDSYSECQIFCPIRHRRVIARAKPVAISFAAHKGDCFVVALLAMTDPAKWTIFWQNEMGNPLSSLDRPRSSFRPAPDTVQGRSRNPVEPASPRDAGLTTYRRQGRRRSQAQVRGDGLIPASVGNEYKTVPTSLFASVRGVAT